MLRVRYFSKGERSYPSSRYRAYQFAAALSEEGVELNIEPMLGASWMRSGRPGGGAWRRLSLGAFYGLSRLVSSARPQRADLLVIEQELVPLLPVGVERLLLGAQAPVVIELDDAHHLVPHRRAKMEAWFGSADAVIVGNEVLAQAVRQAGGRPLVVPTCVNLDHYPSDQLAAHEELEAAEPLQLVWVGLPANVAQLLTVREALSPLLREGSVRLTVVTDPKVDLDGLDAQVVAWSEEAERRAMRAAHVGLMPLPDTPWAEGKCALKLLQYQAAGLPAVASPVGMNVKLSPQGGVMLAETSEEWAAALLRLRSGSLRRRLAEQGRELVAQAYSVQHWAPKLALMYRSLVAA